MELNSDHGSVANLFYMNPLPLALTITTSGTAMLVLEFLVSIISETVLKVIPGKFLSCL
jgi:hypothetical protein